MVIYALGSALLCLLLSGIFDALLPTKGVWVLSWWGLWIALLLMGVPFLTREEGNANVEAPVDFLGQGIASRFLLNPVEAGRIGRGWLKLPPEPGDDAPPEPYFVGTNLRLKDEEAHLMAKEMLEAAARGQFYALEVRRHVGGGPWGPVQASVPAENLKPAARPPAKRKSPKADGAGAPST
ncbi:MAG: hypothetical protein QOD77_233 [Thermoplasmata archaeon]|nr:hypothetical protein [Thermoplasmata archaeon]